MANKHRSGNHSFAQVPSASIPRSAFDRSSTLKTTFDASVLVPIFCDEVLPGDTFSLQSHLYGRLATPLKPILDDLYLDTFYFFVPHRLVWDNFKNFHGEEVDPGDRELNTYTVPVVNTGSVGVGLSNFYDYIGIAPLAFNRDISALYGRSNHLIWNEWFRDQNLQDSLIVDKDDGPDTLSDYSELLPRGKRHDYFTSCLPFPQKGVVTPLIIGGTVPVTAAGNSTPLFDAPTGGGLGKTAKALVMQNDENIVLEDAGGIGWGGGDMVWNDPKLEADLSTATANTINELRQAFQIQRLYERDARGGSRYTEIVRSHFGVVSPDARLQRPEYLGGGTQKINITPVPQTSESTGAAEETQKGNLSGYGTTQGSNHGFNKSFTEHGIILGYVCLRANQTYSQGIHKQFLRETRFDFFYPALSHLGEQAVTNLEIWGQDQANGGTAPINDEVFGYQERWAEYRYKPSMLTGKFRHEDPQSLDFWHVAIDHNTLPALDDVFIVEDVPLDRVIAVSSEPHMLLDISHQLRCVRPIPTYSVPGMIDHF